MNAGPTSYPVYLRPVLILSSNLSLSLSSGHFPLGFSNNISDMPGWQDSMSVKATLQEDALCT